MTEIEICYEELKDKDARLLALEAALRNLFVHFLPEHLDAASASQVGTDAHKILGGD